MNVRCIKCNKYVPDFIIGSVGICDMCKEKIIKSKKRDVYE